MSVTPPMSQIHVLVSAAIADPESAELFENQVGVSAYAVQALVDRNFFVGERDPKIKPDREGCFMVSDNQGVDGYVIVGDSLGDLVSEALSHLEIEPAYPRVEGVIRDLLGDAKDDALNRKAPDMTRAKREDIFERDGTLKGVGYRAATDRRGAALGIKLGVHKSPGFVATMFVIEGRDFHQVFSKVVGVAAGFHGVSEGSDLWREMEESSSLHLRKFGLKLVEVRYEVAVSQDRMPVLAKGKEDEASPAP